MLNLKPHKVVQDNATRTDKVVSVDPYIRISSATQYENSAGKICYRKTPAIFLQGGQYYTEDSRVVKELPAWAPAEIAKISPHALAEAGFGAPEKAAKARRKRKYVRRVAPVAIEASV